MFYCTKTFTNWFNLNGFHLNIHVIRVFDGDLLKC